MIDAVETQPAGLSTLGQVAGEFLRRRSPQVMLGGLGIAVLLRLLVADGTRWQWWDLAAVLMVITLAPFFEWVIHLVVLHQPARRFGPILFDPGAGHRYHHQQPTDINSVLLEGPEAAVFQLVNAAVAALLLGPVLWFNDALVIEPILTAAVAASAALAHYEWSHFLFHTPYRPKTRYYRRLKRNHRLHHWRNERFWLGVTSNLGDRLFRTYRAERSAVPLSPTARTLKSSTSQR